MSNPISRAEVILDKENTEKDLKHIAAIIENLYSFIYETDEDRRYMQLYLMKFEALHEEAQALLSKINLVLETMPANDPIQPTAP